MTTPQQSGQQEVPDFVPVAKMGDIQPGQGKLVRPQAGRLRGKMIALFNDGGNYLAVNYICPHSGGPLGEGSIADGILTCPLHGWSFHLETGQPHNSQGHPIVAYEIKMEGDSILLGSSK
jgi:nitrite reductase/ring-hydroxylating ferredoxin subunit